MKSLLLPLLLGTVPFLPPGTGQLDPDQYLKNVKNLSSAELEGRGSGSPGQKAAATYLEAQFRKIGLRPAVEDSYFQEFSVRIPGRRVIGSKNKLALFHGEEEWSVDSADHQPFGFSARKAVSGDLVFVGYSITDASLGYDDFAGIDVKGKVALCLRHSPGEARPDSPFGPVHMKIATFVNKARSAARAGASALILVNDTLHEKDQLVALSVAGEQAKIPVLQMRRRWAEKILQEAAGMTLKEAQTRIDSKLKPHSLALPGMRAEIVVDHQRTRTETRKTENVLGLLPGSDPILSRELVVIGAHYDHVGRGYFGASPQHRGNIHHGADDNASGTAGLLAIAASLKSLSEGPKRSILFAAFSGEELGLLGSAHYVKHPVIPLDRTVAMVNLDMIGRSKNGYCEVSGLSTSKAWKGLLHRLNEPVGLKLKLVDRVSNDSDHAPFARKKIPVIFFFTGFHPDYHRPTDTWEKINVKDALRVCELAARSVLEVANRPERITFRR